MKPRLFWIIAATFLCSCASGGKTETEDCPILPRPQQVDKLQGEYVMRGEQTVAFPDSSAGAHTVFRYLSEALRPTGISLKQVDQGTKASIRWSFSDQLAEEAYTLTITPETISICSNPSAKGLFYGVQSLLQLLPPSVWDTKQKPAESYLLPAMNLTDAPRFAYRGAMMDVGRNFLPKEAVLKMLDLMAFYKLNRFHFHLTDDQGWRIEIKKYPQLTEKGAYRKQTQVGHCDYYFPRRYDGIEKRGFYTQDEIREIVRYAADRFITVIPEIEMPGHSSAALACYPDLSCGLGKTYVVRDYYDVFDEVYCPKEHTFRFLEDVLTEVINLFPSHYIHIGGDECPKKAWKKCSHCQALMKQLNLPDESALQSWFIHRIEKFVNSRGRDIIGWDEILEGGLAPRATVMSWRGEAGGIEAARQQHAVIMTPGEYCYFDFYQEDPEEAPLAIGGYLPLDKVYSYNPLPGELTGEEQKYIIGVQANIWGEYIQTPEYFEYMTFPRLIAMSEVQWTQPERKDFASFARRLDREFERLSHRGVNACRHFYNVLIEGGWKEEKKTFEVDLHTLCPDADIRYAIGDSVITPSSARYEHPIVLTEETTVYAQAFRQGKPLGNVTRRTFTVNKATGCRYACTPAAEWEYTREDTGLTDGVRGYAKNLRCWGRLGQDTARVTLTLHQTDTLREVRFASVWRPANELWPPRAVRVSVSTDGQQFTTVGEQALTYDFSPTEGTRYPVTIHFSPVKAAYLQVEWLPTDRCPKGYFNEGNPCKLAIDELEVW
ncbi:beta-hexosaminidase precursor [gut metagenome]|uniref:beta-N-acetylhexosaminidase n=1 Tax=gut metagenome TaxID=749906 RepID=J9F633_9ZZZZ